MYVAGSAFFLFKFISGVLYLVYLERKSCYEKFNDLYIRRVRNMTGTFTFFNWIFVGNEVDKNQQGYEVILTHEKAHAALGHTYDLVFIELFKVCFWWLPSTWFIDKEIRKLHEYQADAYALKSYEVDEYSSVLAGSALKLNGLSLVSSFHDNLILKRLIAMKQQATNLSPLKLASLSALCALLFTVFACSEEPNKMEVIDDEVGGDIFTLVEERPEFEGGMDAFYNYLSKELNYPLQARQKGVEGRVIVQFVVEKDGALSNVEVVSGIGAGCDSEAVRVVQNAPAFSPGKQRGKPVRVRMVLPVVFKLGENKTGGDSSVQATIAVGQVEQKNGKLKVDAHYDNGEWAGTIYDEEGGILPGANIVVAGTTTGTASDMEGSFKVKADESADLYVSFVGYESVLLKGK